MVRNLNEKMNTKEVAGYTFYLPASINSEVMVSELRKVIKNKKVSIQSSSNLYSEENLKRLKFTL